jgi:hypothetical protein
MRSTPTETFQLAYILQDISNFFQAILQLAEQQAEEYTKVPGPGNNTEGSIQFEFICA